MFDQQRLTPALGAVLHDVDMGAASMERLSEAMYLALLDHQVIFIRNTDIRPEVHLALAETFGANPPAATMIECGLIDSKYRIEIEVTALAPTA